LKDSELILNPDGSVYHLALLPKDISNLIITVGDPKRVQEVSRFFDHIDLKKQNREFEIHTGSLNNQRITCLSTGMGTDNIDIVLNELDALVNVDFNTRKVKEHKTVLRLVRIGTSGSINKNINVGDVLYSQLAIGLEGLMNWYKPHATSDYEAAWLNELSNIDWPIRPFVQEADHMLIDLFKTVYSPGITLTTGGFYAPQNRSIRLKPSMDVISALDDLSVNGQQITNIEMETAGIYGLSSLLGHKALSINLILANRKTGEFAQNPDQLMQDTIQKTLHILCS